MKDFRVNVRVTNANIQRSIEGMGYMSMPKWCADFDYSYSTLHSFISLKNSPIAVDGSIKPTAQNLCDKLGESFDNLFSEHQRDALATNRASVDVSFDEMIPMLQSDGNELLEHVFEQEKNAKVRMVLNTLTPREAYIISARYGIDAPDPITREALGEMYGVNGNRIMQIENKAVRKLQHPNRANLLKKVME